jgi:hypothetical protein
MFTTFAGYAEEEAVELKPPLATAVAPAAQKCA